MSVKINLSALSDYKEDGFKPFMVAVNQLMQTGGRLTILTDSQQRHLICEDLQRINEIGQESIALEVQSDDLRCLLLRAHELNLEVDLTAIRTVLNQMLDEKPKYFPHQITTVVLENILSFMDIKDLFSFGLANLYAAEVIREIKKRDPSLIEDESAEQAPTQTILKAQEKWEKLQREKNNNVSLARAANAVRDRQGLDFFAFSFESSILQDY
jgi:hypothetical protein